MGLIGNYYNAGNIFMYEMDEDGKVIDVYNWGGRSCKCFSELDKDVLFNCLDRPVLQSFTNEHRITFIENIELIKETDVELYEVFERYNIKSFMIGMMKKNGRDAGVIFLSNPEKHVCNFTVLATMLGYVSNEIIRHQLWKQRTYELTHDIMTGSYNRVSYVEFVNEIKEVESLGLVIADINGLKKVMIT